MIFAIVNILKYYNAKPIRIIRSLKDILKSIKIINYKKSEIKLHIIHPTFHATNL